MDPLTKVTKAIVQEYAISKKIEMNKDYVFAVSIEYNLKEFEHLNATYIVKKEHLKKTKRYKRYSFFKRDLIDLIKFSSSQWPSYSLPWHIEQALNSFDWFLDAMREYEEEWNCRLNKKDIDQLNTFFGV